MITKEEFEKAVEVCNSEFKTCEDCPLRHKAFLCGVYLTKYIKNELASAATGTSSEVSKDTNSTHLDDSTLLDICQEGLCTVAQTRNADYQIGYADAVLDAIKKLRGEQSD
ncbi:hypothetical protein [Ruminococcus sp.]|uniref:hypothetical protein n=1 Tax=Ruminococcus sp. TaxID=41978 RepID=UPI002E79213E|nr:hypothetical protein [Ruminococcus sp.]MEE0560793.1 hypothetical protein [Ruminococcus sp.]